MSAERLAVRIGEIEVACNGAVLYTVGLGSCVAVALYDRETRVGGLAHVMLPRPLRSRKAAPPGRFATTAIPALIDRMCAEGAEVERLRARVAGGAAMFATLLSEKGLRLGERNVEATRAALDDAGIPLDGEEVGGEHGRSVYLETTTGQLRITSVHHETVVL